jgi:hypothetical protein
MFELMVNGQVFVSESYDAFCKDKYMWEAVQRASNFQGTGRIGCSIALALHSEVTKVIQSKQFDQWFGIYKPYSVPAIGFKVSKEVN